MTDLQQRIGDAVASIRKRTKIVPEAAIVLGTGLGGLVANVKDRVTIPYKSIPHFPVSTVQSHSGNLILGTLSGRSVVVMQGRFHRYEGYSFQDVVFPIRVMGSKGGLGARTLLLTNAAGGLNPQFHAGDIMIITDHINLMANSPLVGRNADFLGDRFPDMSEPYTKRLRDQAEEIARKLKIPVRQGVLVGNLGPTLETGAEYRFLRTIGGDATGMSTIPETIAAVHMGMDVFGMSIITNECFPDSLAPATHEHNVEVASRGEAKMTNIIKELVKKLGKK
ncbi:MAG TPA: purine-nucleoside phosphorylase [Bacteroidota bacterium]|nr:purine-nucleoside phosphorylase [Bacteroidota bacterium]